MVWVGSVVLKVSVIMVSRWRSIFIGWDVSVRLVGFVI